MTTMPPTERSVKAGPTLASVVNWLTPVPTSVWMMGAAARGGKQAGPRSVQWRRAGA